MVIESIIIGAVVGVVVAAAGALIGYKLRRKEMRELWAEEERRRKSDRRREIYERDLKIVSDSMHALTEAMTKGWREKQLGLTGIFEAHEMMLKCIPVVNSFEDAELTERFQQAFDAYRAWYGLIDFSTGKAKEKGEGRFAELATRT